MFTISCPPKVIWLGRKGENEFRTIEVEVSEWLREYPNGTVSVVYHRPDGAIYLPAVTTSGNVTSWLIAATDTAIAGRGEVEFRIIDGDVIGKSVKMPTMVSAAINATTDTPAPPPADWAAVAAEILGMIGDLANLDTEAKNNLVDAVNEIVQGGGTNDHRQLTHRNDADQHPMSAITGLVEAIAAKGTYSKPAGGIPASDLASAVQTSLGLADTAVQPEAGKGLFSGNYNDLTNKPTIPTVNDAVLTIKQGGVTKGTFSANASSATEINLDAGGGGGSDEVYIVHITLLNGGYHFTVNESWDTILDALYDFDQNIVAKVWNADGDEEQYVYSFAGYSNTSGHEHDFVFYRCEGNKTSYLYVHDDNTISAEVVDIDDYAQKSDLNDYRTAAAQDTIDSGFVKLVGTAGQTIQTNVAVPLNVKNNIALQHRAFVGFQTHDDNAIGFIGVDGGKPTFLAADGVTAKALQSETIADTAGYYTTDTVEGALAEIGGTLDGLEDAINTIRGVS